MLARVQKASGAQDRQGIGEKSLRIFPSLWDAGPPSVRHRAPQTGRTTGPARAVPGGKPSRPPAGAVGSGAGARRPSPGAGPRPRLGLGVARATRPVQALQRASAAVAGRNGSGAQRPPQPRGGPQPRATVWTGRHPCACRAADGTTPASRFVAGGRARLSLQRCPRLWRPAQPRRRKHQGARSH